MDELAKRENTAMVDQKTGRPRGLDAFEQGDVVIPRIAIAQSTSKRVADGQITVGSIYNTITGEAYVREGKPYIEIVVVAFSKSRRLWDKSNKDNTLCMSNDSKVSTTGAVCATGCPFPGVEGAKNAFDWGLDVKDPNKKVAPACTQYFNYLSMIEPFNSTFPLSVSMGRTSAKAAKNFNSLIVMTEEDIFSRVYALSTESKENKLGRFHIFKVTPVGRVTPDLYKKAEDMAVRMKTISYSIHEEEASEAGESKVSGEEIPF